MNTEQPQPLPPARPIPPCKLSPFTLFEPVPTLETENMTYIETLLGLINAFNAYVVNYNTLVNFINDNLLDLPTEMTDLKTEMQNLQTQVSATLIEFGNRLDQLSLAISNGDRQTLDAAKEYAEQLVANVKFEGYGGYMYGALTAEEYDNLQFTAEYYDALGWTAIEYDTRAKWILYGEDGAIYLDFKDTVNVTALGTVFDLANPPVKLNKRYQIEVSLGTFNLDSGAPAHLEIVGQNTLGATLPITVPSGGSSTVVGIFTAVPTEIRGMSGQENFTGYNAYVKIKPLGDK